MNVCWAVQLPTNKANALGPLRKRSELEVCEASGSLWIRVGDVDDQLLLALRALPGRRYRVLADHQLIPVDARVPEGNLPDGPWRALVDWLTVELPQASYPGQVQEQTQLRLVRGGQVAEANVLETTFDRWLAYAIEAPSLRLKNLAFAIDGRQRVIIRGAPLPALVGQRFVESEGVAAPAGWTWRPAVDAAILRDVLRLAPDDLAMLREDGSWDRLEAGDFVRATRSAVRLSAATNQE